MLLWGFAPYSTEMLCIYADFCGAFFGLLRSNLCMVSARPALVGVALLLACRYLKWESEDSEEGKTPPHPACETCVLPDFRSR